MKKVGIELFAGAGGFGVGFHQLGFKIPVANDIWVSAANTYKANFPETEYIVKDIYELSVEEILERAQLKRGEAHVLIGGPPCQGFSTVGKRFIDDPRNRLFKEYVRMVEGIYPKVFVMENVVGITNMQKGKVVEEILNSFEAIGYKVEWKVLNALHYGVPQNRERAIFIGTRYDIDIVFPEPLACSQNLTIMDAISDLPPVKAGEEKTIYEGQPLTNYQKDRRKDCRVLSWHCAVGHSDKLIRMMEYIPDGGSVWDLENLPTELKPTSGYKNTYSRLNSKEPAMTITRNFSCVSSSRCIHPFQNRGLTPREAARIQSFDDDYFFWGKRGDVSLQIGNAVPPLLGKSIASAVDQMLQAIEKNSYTMNSLAI